LKVLNGGLKYASEEV